MASPLRSLPTPEHSYNNICGDLAFLRKDIVAEIVALAEDERPLHNCQLYATTAEDYGMKITRLAHEPIIRPHIG